MFIISKEFYRFLNNARKLNVEKETLYAEFFASFVEEFMGELKLAVDSHTEIQYTGDWSESFTYQIETLAAGFGERLYATVYNSASHAPFVAYGSQPSHKAGVPYGLQEWIRNKLGIDDPREVYAVGKRIFSSGAHQSSNSPFQKLPPQGRAGYDPVLELDERGVIQYMAENELRELGQKIINRLRVGY